MNVTPNASGKSAFHSPRFSKRKVYFAGIYLLGLFASDTQSAAIAKAQDKNATQPPANDSMQTNITDHSKKENDSNPQLIKTIYIRVDNGKTCPKSSNDVLIVCEIQTEHSRDETTRYRKPKHP